MRPPRLRSRAPLPCAAHVCPRRGFVAQLAEQPPLKRTDRVRLSTKPLGALRRESSRRRPCCARSSLRARIFDNSKGRADDAHRARRGWALLDALPGGEAETQAAVNRPTAGSNPALAAARRSSRKIAGAFWEHPTLVASQVEFESRRRLPRPVRLLGGRRIFTPARSDRNRHGVPHPSTADPVTALR